MTTVPEQFISNRPNGWSDLFQTLRSIIPRPFGPRTAAQPSIGSPAPALREIKFDAPTLVAFVRHCGCPFAEKEVRILGETMQSHPSLRVVIVQHSPEQDTQDWFERVRGHELLDDKRTTLLSDPARELYAQWGVGELGWTAMVNADIMRTLHKQKVHEGLDITKSDWASYRWQNSGGFAVDAQGVVRWVKIAEDSSDVCQYGEAAKTLEEGMA